MLEWASDIDIFEELINEKYVNIDTPLVINNVLITQYNYTKLYHNVVLHRIHIQGKDNDIENFKLLLDNRYQPLRFKFDGLSEVESFWLSRYIQLLLYKNYHFNVTSVINIDNIFTPYINTNYIYVKDNIDIDFTKVIGYLPLIDTYIEKVDLPLATSDLINILDLSLFDYVHIYGIPSIKINGDTHQRINATMTEFGYHQTAYIVTNLYHLIQNTFIIEQQDRLNELINMYKFKVMLKKDNLLYLQHSFLNKEWIVNNMDRINDNKLPLIKITGEWVWAFNPTFETKIYLYYAAILNSKSYDVEVDDDLAITLPLYDNNVEVIKCNINKTLNQPLPSYTIHDTHGQFIVDKKWISIDILPRFSESFSFLQN